MTDNIGPTKFESFRCGLCKYHRIQMVHSGMNPLYRHFCDHDNREDDGFIGYDDNTPGWCPERNNP